MAGIICLNVGEFNKNNTRIQNWILYRTEPRAASGIIKLGGMIAQNSLPEDIFGNLHEREQIKKNRRIYSASQ